MNNPRQALENVLRIHRARLATYEVREDFPLLRLNKSIHAYRAIASFQTIPLPQRMEVAMALAAAAGGVAGSERDQLLRKAFNLRSSRHTIDELESMSLEPTPLDLDLDDDRFRELQGGDILGTLIRQIEAGPGKAEIRKCFLARFKETGEGEILPARREGELYELAEVVSGWTLTTQLEFGGKPLNQFYCTFQLKHDLVEERWRFSAGRLLGLGDLRWNDIHRETLEQDAQMAVQLWRALRHILTEIIKAADANSSNQT